MQRLVKRWVGVGGSGGEREWVGSGGDRGWVLVVVVVRGWVGSGGDRMGGLVVVVIGGGCWW